MWKSGLLGRQVSVKNEWNAARPLLIGEMMELPRYALLLKVHTATVVRRFDLFAS